MKAIHIFILSFFLLSFGCKIEKLGPSDEGNTHIGHNRVDFENPKHGQETIFLRYESVCDTMAKFYYTGDTLRLRVVEENDTLYFEESLTENSPMYIDNIFRKPFRQKLMDEKGRILIPEREESPLFFFYGNDTLTLAPEKRVPLYHIGCRFFSFQGPFIGNDIGKIDSVAFGDIELKYKTVVSCVPSPFQVDAYLVYSQNELFMSQATVPSLNDLVQGWIKQD